MKIKELIQQLNKFDADTNVELFYAFHTLSADMKPVKTFQQTNFNVVEAVDGTQTVLLATNNALTD